MLFTLTLYATVKKKHQKTETQCDQISKIRLVHSYHYNIQSIGYEFFSFDATSLLTNIPLNRDVKTTLKAIYNDKVFPTTLRTLKIKGIILEASTKTVFIFNKKFKQWSVHAFTDRSCFGQYHND